MMYALPSFFLLVFLLAEPPLAAPYGNHLLSFTPTLISLSYAVGVSFFLLQIFIFFFDLVLIAADGPIYDSSAYTQVNTKPGNLLHRFFS